MLSILTITERVLCCTVHCTDSQVLKDENGRLYKLLGERDEEMRILRKARDEEKRALAGEEFDHSLSSKCSHCQKHTCNAFPVKISF